MDLVDLVLCLKNHFNYYDKLSPKQQPFFFIKLYELLCNTYIKKDKYSINYLYDIIGENSRYYVRKVVKKPSKQFLDKLKLSKNIIKYDHNEEDDICVFFPILDPETFFNECIKNKGTKDIIILRKPYEDMIKMDYCTEDEYMKYL